MKQYTFLTYSNGWSSDATKLPEAIKQALDDFAQRTTTQPAALAINPQVANEARAVLTGLGVSIDVVPNGGTLLGEVWCALPEGCEVSKCLS